MREILFRGQTGRYGEKVNMAGDKMPSNWVYGGIFPQNKGGDFAVIYQQEPEVKKFPVYADTVGQFTGLTDKNGKRIFEDDIVKIKNQIGYVFFTADDASFAIETEEAYFSMDYSNECEVIGNIHDNPELIGG